MGVIATFLAAGWTHLARLGVAAVGAGYLFMVALGSGISEVASLIGLPLHAEQTVALAGMLAVASLAAEIAALERRLREHGSSPRISWYFMGAELLADGSIRLNVDYENTGPTGSVAILRLGRAWSGASEWTVSFPTGWPLGVGQRRGLAFTSPAGTQYSTGQHDVTWQMVYFDNARPDTHGYLTQETLTLQFDAIPGSGSPVGFYLLDASSSNELRHKRWRDLVKQMKAQAQPPSRAPFHWLDPRA